MKTLIFVQGDLNADYVVRVENFLEMYKKKLAPAVPGPDPAKPLFRGYKVIESYSSVRKRVLHQLRIGEQCMSLPQNSINHKLQMTI